MAWIEVPPPPDDHNEEGLQFSGTTGRSAKNNNPLNLEYRPGSYQEKYGAVLEPRGGGKDKKPRFAAFPDMMSGYLAGIEQIRLDQNKGLTLEQFVHKFAPSFENPTEQLISQYANAVGARRDTPLANIPPEKLIVPMLARESSTKIVGRGANKGILESIGSYLGPSSAEAAEVPPPPSGFREVAPPPPGFKEVAPPTSEAPAARSTGQKLAGRVAQFLEPSAEAAGLLAGGAIGAGSGFLAGGLGAIPGGLAGAGLGYGAAKQGIRALRQYAGEEATQGLAGSALTAAGDVATGMEYEAGGGVLGKVLSAAPGIIRPQVQNIFGRVLKSGEAISQLQLKELQGLSEKYGIDLTVPELTDSPTLKALWTRLANSPGPQSDKIARYIKEVRQPQVASAIQRELASISGAEVSSYEAGALAKDVAQKTEAGLQATRKMATRPLYEKAFEGATPVDTKGVLSDIDKLVETLPEGHPTLGPLNRVKAMIADAGGDLRKLDYAKKGINDVLEGAQREGAINNTNRYIFTNIKAKLSGLMEASSPEYAQAQREYRILSKPINDFRYGDPNIQPRDPRVKTTIARIADIGPENVEGAATEVFKGMSPEKITRTRQWFVQGGNEEAWNILMRTRLEEQLGKIRGAEFDNTKNIGALFQGKAMPDKRAMDVWQAALGPEKFAQLKDFMTLLDATRRIVYTNSQTAFQIEAGKILEKGGVGELISKVPTSTGQLIEWALRQFDKIRQPHFAAQLTDAMLNPANAEKVAKLQQMKDSPKKALLFLDFLGSSVFKEEAVRRDQPPQPQSARGFTILNQ